MKDSWFVYIVQCRDKTLYTGCTNDVTRRIRQHNEGHGARYTKARCPVILKYQETTTSHSEALKREAAIKKLPRHEKLQLIKTWRDAQRRKDRATLSVAA